MDSRASDLKEDLVEVLKEIRTIRLAMRFCDLLIKAKKIKEEYGGTSLYKTGPEYMDTFDQIFHDLKTIINDGYANEIVQKFLKVLYASGDKSDKEVQELMISLEKIKNLKPEEKSQEYLNDLYGSTEALVKLLCNERLFYRYSCWDIEEDPKINLVTLKYFLSVEGSSKAEKVLEAIYWIGLEKISFSEEEKREIGPLMPDAFRYILKRIRGIRIGYQARLGIHNLMRRSALEFLKDELADFPVGNATLKEHMAKIESSIALLDSMISRWCHVYENEELYATDSDEDEEDYEMAGGYEAPVHHNWWTTFKKAYFKCQ